MEERRNVRCAMYFAPGIICISSTTEWSRNLCPSHYIGYLLSKGESWIDKVPLGDKIFASSISVPHETWIYTRAIEIQRERAALPSYKKRAHYYADSPDKKAIFYGTTLKQNLQ